MYQHYLFNTCSTCLRYYTDLDNNLPFKHYDDFNLESLSERTELYKKLSELIWSTSQMYR